MTRIFSAGLLLALVLSGTSARAQNDAVSSLNGDISAQAFKIEDPASDIQIYAASANGNIPLAEYLGLNLYLARGHGEGESPPSAGYSYDYLIYSVSPFVRDPKLGLIGVSVGRTEFDLDSSFPVSKLKQKDSSVLVAGYLGPITLSATDVWSQDVDGMTPDQNYIWVDAVWYVAPDFLIDFTAGFKDAKDSYAVALEHQLSSISPHSSYGLGYSWNSDADEKMILLTLTYRFAEKKSLMKRHREDLFGPR